MNCDENPHKMMKKWSFFVKKVYQQIFQLSEKNTPTSFFRIQVKQKYIIICKFCATEKPEGEFD